MKISLITPTHNRAELLDETMKSIIMQNVGDAKFEYLVVDNNSKDNTKETIEKYIGKNDNIEVKYVFEKNLGINYARNTGIKESQGDYLIFFDDDVILEKDCLLSYINAFQEYPDQKIFGGRVLIKTPEFDIPNWLPLDGKYTRRMIVLSLNYGEKNCIRNTKDNIPLGGNMGLPKDVFQKHGVFRTDLGLKGKGLLPGSEYQFLHRMENDINKWVYVAGGIVYHPIKQSQAKKSYFRKRLFGVGRITYRFKTFEAKKKVVWIACIYFGVHCKKFFAGFKIYDFKQTNRKFLS